MFIIEQNEPEVKPEPFWPFRAQPEPETTKRGVAGYFSFDLTELTRQRSFGRLFCVISAEISGQLVFGGVSHSSFSTKSLIIFQLMIQSETIPPLSLSDIGLPSRKWIGRQAPIPCRFRSGDTRLSEEQLDKPSLR